MPKRSIAGGFILFGAALAAVATARAETEEPLVPDRPGFLVSSATVGADRLHVEFGLAYERDRQPGLKRQTWTTPLSLRYGLDDDLELRWESDDYTRQREGGLAARKGISDMSLGLKWRDDVDSAWWLSVELPTGSREFKTVGLRPALYRVLEWPLSKDSALALMPGIKYDRDDAGHYWSGALAGAYSRQWNERIGMAVALEGQQLASARHGGNLVDLNLALTYLVSKDCLLDAAASFGLNDHTPDLALTLGVSLRF